MPPIQPHGMKNHRQINRQDFKDAGAAQAVQVQRAAGNGNHGVRFKRSQNNGDGRFRKPEGNVQARRLIARSRPPENFVKITSDLQITDGNYRGRMLQNSVSPSALPTKGRLRETMFRIIFRDVRGCRFLDLCAGAGTIGIEAISRGAMLCTFVERSSKMCSFLRKNIDEFEVRLGHAEIVEMEILPFLRQMAGRRRCWDILYFDLPDEMDRQEVFRVLGRGTTVAAGGILLIEHNSEEILPEKIGRLRRGRTIVRDETSLSFYERR